MNERICPGCGTKHMVTATEWRGGGPAPAPPPCPINCPSCGAPMGDANEAPPGGGTATRAQLQAMRDLSIPFDLEHPPTFDDAARLIREAEEAENPMRVAMGPPGLLVIDASEHTYCPDPNDPHNPPRDVRDIREAMHPAGEGFTFASDGGGIEAMHSDDLTPEDAAAFTRQQDVNRPYVATLPDGTRVNLPAGTVLREGEDTNPTEHPVIALVRSFVGKPGDRGPVWSALMRLRERLDESGDLAAIDLGDELVNALNERLGQMHDALGRDPIAEVSR